MVNSTSHCIPLFSYTLSIISQNLLNRFLHCTTPFSHTLPNFSLQNSFLFSSHFILFMLQLFNFNCILTTSSQDHWVFSSNNILLLLHSHWFPLFDYSTSLSSFILSTSHRFILWSCRRFQTKWSSYVLFLFLLNLLYNLFYYFLLCSSNNFLLLITSIINY